MSKPFIERLVLDNTNLKIIRENRQKAGGFTVFKSSFLSQIWNNVKTNWLMLIFCLPALLWIVVSQINQVEANVTLPYSGNIGVGYPVVEDVFRIGAQIDFDLAIKRALYMLPLIVVASVGLAGVFNVIKYFCWGFKIKIAKTFFMGIKNSFTPFIWVGLMLGVCYLLLTYVLNVFTVTEAAFAVRAISIGFTIILCYFVILISLFITTGASVFNLSLRELLKNSFLLGTRFIIQNSMVALVGLLSMLLPFLTFNSFVHVIAYVLFFMMAFSYLATVWTIYAHTVYDMMYDDKPEKQPHRPKNQRVKTIKVVKDDGVEKPLANDNELGGNNQKTEAKKPATNTKKFVNPKKKKKQ